MKVLKNHILNTLISKLLIAFCSMGVVIITSQVLGAEGRGVISYLLLLIMLAQVVAEFVGGSALINLAPNEKLINLLVPSYVAAILVSTGLWVIVSYLETVAVAPWLLALICLFLCIANINLSLILGRQGINKRNAIQFSYTILLLSGVYFVYWINGELSIVPYFEMLAFAYAVGVLLSTIVLLQVSKPLDFIGFEWTKKIFKFGFWSQLSQLINLLNFRLAYFFVERDFGMASLGIYGNAMTIGEMMKIPGHSLGQVQHNRIINKTEDSYFAKSITGKYLVLNMVLYALQWIVLLALPGVLWSWLLGGEFSTLKSVLLILLPGFVAMGVATSFSFYFHAINRFKTVLLVNLVTLFTVIIVYYSLKNSLGFDAILYAFSTAYTVHLLLFVGLYYRQQNTPFLFKSILKERFK